MSVENIADFGETKSARHLGIEQNEALDVPYIILEDEVIEETEDDKVHEDDEDHQGQVAGC